MDQIRPIIIKFIYTAAISIIFLTYLLVPSVPILTTLILAVIIALVLYYAGDRFILPRYGALIAAITGFVLTALIFSMARSFIRQPLTAGAIFTSAAVIGIAEWFYYRYAREAPVMEGQISGSGDDQGGGDEGGGGEGEQPQGEGGEGGGGEGGDEGQQ